MSRTYSNFLLFEDVLDGISNSSTIMAQAVKLLLNPVVRVLAFDCDTLLGEIRDTSYEMEGMVEVATKARLSRDRISQLLQSGQYKTGIRTLSTCQTHTWGGICQACYQASLFTDTSPNFGDTVVVPSYLVYQTDTLLSDGNIPTFDLSQTSDDWYSIKVFNNGTEVPTSNYTLGFDTITFNPLLPQGSVYVVHFLKLNTEPFQGYIAQTYSGALLGMQPLPTLKPMLRMALYEQQFSDGFIGLLMDELSTLKAIPSTYIDFVNNVHGKMEKVLLALYMYALYSNVEI